MAILGTWEMVYLHSTERWGLGDNIPNHWRLKTFVTNTIEDIYDPIIIMR